MHGAASEYYLQGCPVSPCDSSVHYILPGRYCLSANSRVFSGNFILGAVPAVISLGSGLGMPSPALFSRDAPWHPARKLSVARGRLCLSCSSHVLADVAQAGIYQKNTMQNSFSSRYIRQKVFCTFFLSWGGEKTDISLT